MVDQGARWEFCARTDVGRTRERNEDNFLVIDTRVQETSSNEDGAGPFGTHAIGSFIDDVISGLAPAGLLVVADGMGGHANGNIASLCTVESLRDWYDSHDPIYHDLVKEKIESEALVELAYAIGDANMEIFRRNRGAFSIEGMGTTIVALLCFDDNVVTACVGDSRIYLYREGKLEQVTKDHSLIEELIRYNIIGEQDIFLSPNKNIITRALGMNETVEVDTQLLEAKAGDVWLLCSDGLTDMVEDEWIAETLKRAHEASLSLEASTNELVDLANERGGIDNITVLLARCMESSPDNS